MPATGKRRNEHSNYEHPVERLMVGFGKLVAGAIGIAIPVRNEEPVAEPIKLGSSRQFMGGVMVMVPVQLAIASPIRVKKTTTVGLRIASPIRIRKPTTVGLRVETRMNVVIMSVLLNTSWSESAFWLRAQSESQSRSGTKTRSRSHSRSGLRNNSWSESRTQLRR